LKNPRSTFEQEALLLQRNCAMRYVSKSMLHFTTNGSQKDFKPQK